MNCPYCGQPMEQGRLYGVSPTMDFTWIPEGTRPPLLFGNSSRVEEKGGMHLNAQRNWLKKSYLEVFICRACGKGIFSFSSEEPGE